MKSKIIASIIAIVSIFSATAQEPPEKPAVASIAGDWKVRTTAEVWTFAAPNTMTSSAGSKATWKETEASKYELTFAATTAKVTISADGKSLSAVSPSGKTIDADRVVVAAAVDPIIGRWRHQHNAAWTVNADGTIKCSSGAYGTWKLVKASPFERKYLMVWAWNRGKRDRADGVLADTVMGRDTKTMKSKFQRDANEVFNLERLDQ